MKNPIKKMLRTHKEYCQMLEQKVRLNRVCTCDRDDAIQLYDDMEDFLIKLDEWLEEKGTLVRHSAAHQELGSLIERLA